ncbi:MAG: M20/M25/M40 family metallo-hydrolase [Acidobacteriota bacterium]|nr:M20/M25/M40 family metallo-hydrolase [Acidobacteriota bacterium]
MNDSVLALLRDLVAIDSVNPSLVPGGAGEAGVADRVAAELRRAGLDVIVRDVAPNRPNVVGVLEGRADGQSLMFCGHLDTVGIEGMTAPFDPVVADGRLYGRGSQDMKSGVAAMVDAATELATHGGLDRGRLVIAAVVDEEHASLGADMVSAEYRADAAVVTEPTGLRLATCHKGFEWVELETVGTAAHGSRPADGRDAILRMGRVLHRLEVVNTALAESTSHPLLGPASLHASTIDGGRELSVYPDRCRLTFERRTLLGEPPDAGLTEVQAILDALHHEDSEFDASARPLLTRPPHAIEPAAPICQALSRVLTSRGHPDAPVGMSFWTDAAILTHAGTPTVLFGPTGAGLHSRDEYVEIESVLTCRDVLVDLARDFC